MQYSDIEGLTYSERNALELLENHLNNDQYSLIEKSFFKETIEWILNDAGIDYDHKESEV